MIVNYIFFYISLFILIPLLLFLIIKYPDFKNTINILVGVVILSILLPTTIETIEYKKYGNEIAVPIPVGILSIVGIIILGLILVLLRNRNITFFGIKISKLYFSMIIFWFFGYTIYFYSYYQNSCKTSGFFKNFIYVIGWLLITLAFKFFRVDHKYIIGTYTILIIIILILSIYTNYGFLNLPIMLLVIYILYLIFTFMSNSVLYIMKYLFKKGNNVIDNIKDSSSPVMKTIPS
jgi:hypothetical protein